MRTEFAGQQSKTSGNISGISLENIADHARVGTVVVGWGSKLFGRRDQPPCEPAMREWWEDA